MVVTAGHGHDDYYVNVNGRRKRERIGADKRLAETVLRKRKVEIAEGRFFGEATTSYHHV
jgi:hypothetical protein